MARVQAMADHADLIKVSTDNAGKPAQGCLSGLLFPVGCIASVEGRSDMPKDKVDIGTGSKIFRADGCPDTIKINGTEECCDAGPQHAGIDEVSCLQPFCVGQTFKVVKEAERNNICGRAADINENGIRIQGAEIIGGGKPVGCGKLRYCMVMELCIGTVKPGAGKSIPDSSNNKRDTLQLAVETIGKLPAHHDNCRVLIILAVLSEQCGNRGFFPERAIVDMDAGIIDNLCHPDSTGP